MDLGFSILMMANINGYTRRAFIIASFCTAYELGALTRSYPNLTVNRGVFWVMSFNCVKLLCLFAYAVWAKVQNRLRGKNASDNSPSELEMVHPRPIGVVQYLTDIENIHFRYSY